MSGGGGPERWPILAPDDLRVALVKIEHDLDARTYRPGQWERFIADLKRRPAAVRAAAAADVSRVSRKLHQRKPRRTISTTIGIVAEVVGAVIGLALVLVAIHVPSIIAGLFGALLWIMSFQPLIKVGAGQALGIQYEYAYLANGEPRFKMKFGTYTAASRGSRILLHLLGTVGSPLGAWLAASIIRPALPGTARVVMVVFWILVITNVAGFVAGLAGVRRLGRIRTADGSGGSAGLELHEALTD